MACFLEPGMREHSNGPMVKVVAFIFQTIGSLGAASNPRVLVAAVS